MAFISKAAKSAAAGGGGGKGGYLTAGKLGDGESHRIAILSEEALDYYTVWGEDAEGTKKPFRFAQEPTQEEIKQEMGDFKQRLNFEGTALEKPKFAMAFFCWDYADEKVKIFEINQKTLIKELDGISQTEDYADLHAWDLVISRSGLKMNTEYKILPAPRKKGSQEVIDAAWSEAQESGYNINALMLGENPFGES